MAYIFFNILTYYTIAKPITTRISIQHIQIPQHICSTPSPSSDTSQLKILQFQFAKSIQFTTQPKRVAVPSRSIYYRSTCGSGRRDKAVMMARPRATLYRLGGADSNKSLTPCKHELTAHILVCGRISQDILLCPF
jgi:hypothetical protein